VAAGATDPAAAAGSIGLANIGVSGIGPPSLRTCGISSIAWHFTQRTCLTIFMVAALSFNFALQAAH
jgi:hypothetical protein